ncbi:hypothetical protein [Bacillus cereus]|uniref:hypothetical protein n=1 Tax=Bacillus cereus TaxID=1396 RepID=UPI000330EAE1|nr:hypothetical protein [Bacillus cereus]EOO44418.1 hypothetical protein ICK_06193 [Bacillus cereus BAG1X2-2]
MAIVKIVSKEDMAIFKKYLKDQDSVILIPEEIAKENNVVHLNDTTNAYYSYQTEPNLFIDIVDNKEHGFMDYLNLKEKGEVE